MVEGGTKKSNAFGQTESKLKVGVSKQKKDEGIMLAIAPLLKQA